MEKKFFYKSIIFILSYGIITILCSISYFLLPELQFLIFCIWYTASIVLWGITVITIIALYAKLVKIKRQIKRKDDKT